MFYCIFVTENLLLITHFMSLKLNPFTSGPLLRARSVECWNLSYNLIN